MQHNTRTTPDKNKTKQDNTREINTIATHGNNNTRQNNSNTIQLNNMQDKKM